MGLHSKSGAEKIGFWLTLICGIHCIATPILLTFLPVIGSKFEAFHKYESYILYGSLFLAIYLMWKDQQIHRNIIPTELVVIAMCVLILWEYFLGKSYEIYLSIIISTLILYAYWLNWKHKEKCKCKLTH